MAGRIEAQKLGATLLGPFSDRVKADSAFGEAQTYKARGRVQEPVIERKLGQEVGSVS